MKNRQRINMRRFWKKHSNLFLKEEDRGLSAVCYTGMPLWFNELFDRFQKKCFFKLLKGISLNEKRILDIGCGVGRWLSIYLKKSKNVFGIDIDCKRISFMKKKIKGAIIKKMDASNLEFKDDSFDFISSITVLQHIPYGSPKERALNEIQRVLKKGGRALIIELQDKFDDAEHVFPLSREEWIKEFKARGFVIEKELGYEYIFLLRLLRFIRYKLNGQKTIPKKGGKAKINKVENLFLRIVVMLSYPLEELSINFCHPKYARHGAFIIRKK